MFDWVLHMPRGGSRTAGISMIERFVIIVNGFQRSILDVAAVLDPPLKSNLSSICERYTGVNDVGNKEKGRIQKWVLQENKP